MSRPSGEELPGLLAQIAGEQDAEEADREAHGAQGARRRGRAAYARLLARLGPALVVSARGAGAVAVASGRWLSDVIMDAAPHIPIRDLETLQAHHGGRSGEELADALVRTAVVATSSVGVAGGALSAVKWTVPVSLVTIPVQLTVEVVAVAAIEIKLVGELHEVYGLPVRGTLSQRGSAYAVAWANRRGINPLDPQSLSNAMGAVARQRVQRRLVGRAGRGLGTAAPFMAGAVFGAYSNQRQTHLLAETLRADLRRKRALTGGLTGRVVGRALESGADGRLRRLTRRRSQPTS
jgi:hypothetical protein